jgi:hypothetical protein
VLMLLFKCASLRGKRFSTTWESNIELHRQP